MLWRVGVFALALAISGPAAAQPDLENGLAGALRGCQEWVLNPSSWAKGAGPFVAKVGLGDKMGLVQSVDEAALPPKELRAGNHYWRINSTPNAGFILVVSDQLPMCHITGGGAVDLQPSVETVLTSSEFQNQWELVKTQSRGDMVSTTYRNREEPKFSMVVSRAKKAGERLDRVQVLATAMID
jgi:hypothetical protein